MPAPERLHPTRTPTRASLALLGAVLFLSGLAASAQGGPGTATARTIDVPVVKATAGPLSGGQIFQARLEPVRQSVLTAQTNGRVLTLAVAAGASVRAGQVLLRVDDREVAAALQAGDAGVAEADAAARQAELTLARQRSLAQSGFLSPAAVEQAETQRDAAAAAARQARARQSQAQVARGFASVTAPFDGRVLATHVEPGELAQPGRPLVTVYQPERLRAVVSLPVGALRGLPPPERLELHLDDGRRVKPVSSEILPGADPVSQTLTWRLLLPPQTDRGTGAEALRPGQAAELHLAPDPTGGAAPVAGSTAAAAPSTPTVPAQALLRRGELTAVYVATPEGFSLRLVRVGPEIGARVTVLAGLAAGETVALDPVRAGLAGARPAR